MSDSKASSLILNFENQDSEPDVHAGSIWRGFNIEHSTLSLPTGYDFQWQGARHYLCHHDLVLQDGSMDVDGLGTIQGRDLRGKMTYIPQNLSLRGWAKPARRRNSFTVLNFDPGIVSEELEAVFSENDLQPQIYFENPLLSSTMQKLQELLLADSPNTSLYMESLGLASAMEIAMAGRLKMATGLKPRGLGRKQAKRVEDYIETHLAEDITLESMANVAGQSRFHFSRSFKESFGISPIRYITARRLLKAREILSTRQLSLQEVAALTGFGSVQHFIKAFRKETGTTPAQFRKHR